MCWSIRVFNLFGFQARSCTAVTLATRHLTARHYSVSIPKPSATAMPKARSNLARCRTVVCRKTVLKFQFGRPRFYDFFTSRDLSPDRGLSETRRNLLANIISIFCVIVINIFYCFCHRGGVNKGQCCPCGVVLEASLLVK